jgi:hypothetical protein
MRWLACVALFLGTGCAARPWLAELPQDVESEASGCGDAAPPVEPEEDEAPPAGDAPAASGTAAPPAPGPRRTAPRPAARAEEKRRLRYVVEGLISLCEGPRGPFGLESGLPEQIEWDQLDDGKGYGLRVGAQYSLDPRNRIEARWLWTGEWDHTRRLSGVFGFGPAS